MVPFEVIKATGERETFQLSKLKHSLSNAGAQSDVMNSVIKDLEDTGLFTDGISTQKIYREAYRLLKQKSIRIAGRYKLKEALLELGPSGYPFEILISEIFKKLGYATHVGSLIKGECVSHEIDVLAEKDNEYLMMECKFHNRQNHHCNVTIPLYVRSRFVDVKNAWVKQPELQYKNHAGWVVTNTRFTTDASDYANCIGLKLLSWSFPKNNGLKDLIGRTGLHPITCLSVIDKSEKQLLLKNDIVLVRQIRNNMQVLTRLGFDKPRAERIHKEATEILTIT
ncbi:MAG: restriction endonuclease [Gracilimonas sp.]|uniref:restriction endonuclease n=1 Tax=Gracilimonas sp. TaxID=1974203 RepID=UPI00199BFFC9|nr:restriction endonuclease [Gracilimonas sp.]MBD3617272.1 restriction endonuclease [Gracilimonas sp.]